ncbi:MAG: hypothetical protein L0332_23490 [Chloroflexi bacterium]|nr:hypothetical protein [Chloroflexota bacterium]
MTKGQVEPADFERVLDELAGLLVIRDEYVTELERNLAIAADALAPLMDKPHREVVTLSGIALLAVKGAQAAVEELKGIAQQARELRRGKSYERDNQG